MRLAQAILLLVISATPAAEPVEAEKPRGREEAVRVEVAAGALYGTLTLPYKAGPVPVVLLIAGSGPTDRNGNQARSLLFTDNLNLLARGLAERGIAAVRYDRRGVGESAAAAREERDVRLDDFAEDAAAWVRSLRGDARFTAVVVAGHSEGALVGMMAAKRAGADGYVSLAGPGRSLAEILRDQLGAKLDGELRDQSFKILDELAAGRTAEEVPDSLMPLFRPSVQPFLIAVFRYDPAKELAELKAPVLIVQGTTDLQISTKDAERLAEARPDAELLIVRGMNHVLKPAATTLEQTATYHVPLLPLSPEVVEATSKFVRKVERISESK